MKTWLEASHAHQRRSRGRGRCTGHRRRPSSSARRRPTSASTAPSSLQDCVQLHGGIGLTFEHDLHLFLRRVSLNCALYGTPDRTPARARRASSRSQEAVGVNGDAMEELDAFRERARSFVRANLRPVGPDRELRDPARRRVGRGGACCSRTRAGSAADALRRRARGHLRTRRSTAGGADAGSPARAQRGDGWLRVPGTPPGADDLAVRSGHPRLRHRGAEARAPAGDPARRRDLDAVPVRAERRLRRRRRADHRGTRRRRMGSQRLQDLDDRRLVVGLGAVPGPHQLGRAEAPRPDRLHVPDPQPGHRGPPDRDAQRHPGSSARSS